MSLSLLIAIGGLTAAGVYLITSRSLSRVILGFSLLGHATVLALLVAGGPPGEPPIGGGDVANPLPQALALTAIVIAFGLTLFLLALAARQQNLTGDDLVEDDIEDRRIRNTTDAGDRLDRLEDDERDVLPDGSDPGEEPAVA